MFLALRHLKIRHKFVIVAALTLPMFAVPTALLIRGNLATIDAAHRAADGLKPVGDALKLVQLTQQHRGLSATVLGGNEALAGPRQAKQAEVERALGQVEADAAGQPALKRQAEALRQQWQALATGLAGKRMQSAESFAQHTALIRQQLDLLRSMADHSRLTMDPDPGNHHALKGLLEALPQLSEALGQMRARGAVLLQNHAMSPDERARLESLVGLARLHQGETRYAFEQLATHDAALSRRLQAAADTAVASADQAFKLLDEKILQDSGLNFAAADYITAMTRAIDTQFALVDVAFAGLAQRLADRVAARQQELLLTAGTLAAFGAMVLWLSVLVTRQTTRSVERALQVATAVADGDLTTAIESDARDEVGHLLGALGRMNSNLSRMVAQVRQASDNIATGSSQIAAGNADLSQRTEQQAANLEQTAASMEELGATVMNNAETARQAAQVAHEASEVARRGGEVVGQVVGTMDGISAASRRIGDIIGVIDGIAFQTNILALNAAVEAARAGEQGRGFAVVASEVRSLAQRSAEAAREIKSLITASVEQVEAGSQQVADAGATMNDIVTQVQRVNALIGQISGATREQASGVTQVGQAVGQLDQVTQQNAALVEESAAAADSLHQQATSLVQAVSVFRLAPA